MVVVFWLTSFIFWGFLRLCFVLCLLTCAFCLSKGVIKDIKESEVKQKKKVFAILQLFICCTIKHTNSFASRKHAYINLAPSTPHIVKLGFIGLYIIFLIVLNNIDCGYSLQPPRRCGSNEYPQSVFWAEIWKILGVLSEHFWVFGGKIYIFE